MWFSWQIVHFIAAKKAEIENSSSNDRDGTAGTTGTGAKLIVCHGTFGPALLGTAFGKDATTIFRQKEFPNCEMAEIVVWDENKKIASS